jgi:NADH-quinone oxidoreductase subunit N
MIGIGTHADEGTAFYGMFIDDGFSRFAKVVILIAAAAVLATSADYMQRRNMLRFEFPILSRWRCWG